MHSFSEEDIKNKAKELGFNLCRIASTEELIINKKQLEDWFKHGFHGNMHYMEKQTEKKTNPKKVLSEAESVIICSMNYASSIENTSTGKAYKISRYAYGTDYHDVIKPKLQQIISFLKEKNTSVEPKAFVDSGPSMDKVWAKKAGIGWQGKNTCIIHPENGSFFFIGVIIINKKLQADAPIEDRCGTCTKCIDACPTNALKSYVLDARKCISYLNKEADSIPKTYKDKMQDWIFGCDICQEVCLWNKDVKANVFSEFLPKEEQLNLSKKEWEEMDEQKFNSLFQKSAINWLGFDKIKETIQFFTKK